MDVLFISCFLRSEIEIDFSILLDVKSDKKVLINKSFAGVQGAPRRGEPIRGGIVSEDVFHSATCTWNLHLSPLAEKSPLANGPPEASIG
jgi:hypothetical protein